jgi:hypothetical protein
MKEIIYDIEEFKAKVDKTKPLHHCAMRKSIDQHGVFYRIIFRIYGIDKNNGHILIFETQKRTSIAELEQHPQDYKAFVQKYAKPLGSTEGAWMP